MLAIMLRRFILYTMFNYLFLFSIYSQSKIYSIQGKITNSSNISIPYSTIVLKKELDSTIVSGSVTDSIGEFKLVSIPQNKYYVAVSSIGYQSQSFPLFLKKDTLLVILLKEEEQKLNTIDIISKKPLIEKELDKLVFNVSNSNILIGANTIDILRKTPLVNVTSNQIGLFGKGEVKVMLNNKLIQLSGDDLFNYLKSIPSNSILKIEVITNPSAQFDAAGNSGIINIITVKSTKREWNGTIQAVYEQTFYATGETGAYISHSNGKISWFANVSYRNGRRLPVERMSTDYGAQEWKQVTYRKKIENRLSSQIGLDYTINKKSTISVNYTGLISRPGEPATGETIIHNNITNMTDSSFITSNNIKETINSHDINIFYNFLLDTTGKTLTVSSDFFSYQNKKNQQLYSENFYPSGISTDQRINDQSAAPQKIIIQTTSIDYKYPYQKFTFNMGGKFTFINVDNDFVYLKNFISDSTKSNHFIYKEITPAAYFSTSFSLNKFSFQLGLRGEYTNLMGKSITLNTINENHYFKLFPTAFIQYNWNDNHILSISYGRRINRPGYSELNPFRYYLNMYQYAEGNPNLLPSLSNTIETGYLLNQRYVFGIFYQFVNNQFQQIPFIDSFSNSINFTRRNIGNSSSEGIYAVIPINFAKWWESINTITGFIQSQRTRYFQENINYHIPSFTFSTNQQFYFNSKKTIIAELNFQYSAPSRNFLYQISDYYLLDIGVKYSLIDSNLVLGLNVADLFYTGNPLLKSVPEVIQPMTFFNTNDNRMLRFSCIYKFGGDSKLKKNSSNKDEINRIK